MSDRPADQGGTGDLPPLLLLPEQMVTRSGGVQAPESSMMPLYWQALTELRFDEIDCDRGRLISRDRTDPAHIAFDMLRTRMRQAFREHGWSRVAVTSPTKGCGKTFVAANLALSLSHQRTDRVVLFDFDLRSPGLTRVFGPSLGGDMVGFLEGRVSVGDHLWRIDERLAVALTGAPAESPAEILQDPHTTNALASMRARLMPTVEIYDMPPMLACDDVMAFLPQVDCVLIVAGGGITRAEELTRCAKLLENQSPILGIVLNQAEDPDVQRYYY